jgi:site-specific DNA recombinase
METRALQKPLDHVYARRIDDRRLQVDRLTCALAEFAKLVEAHGVSFVSVTHAFNTTVSMGPLTLNMLF